MTDQDQTASAARTTIRDGIDTAREKAGGALDKARDGLDQARSALGGAYDSGRDTAADAYAYARQKVQTAGRSTSEGIEGNPLAALLGGLALGAVIGALLPRTEREERALGTVGDRVGDAAREALDAAKAAGRDKLDDLGISRDKARETIRSLVDGAFEAATSAGNAALESARQKRG